MTSLKNYSEKNRLKTNTYISLLFLTSLVASCSVNKYLPPGEKLFRGEVITIIKNPEIKESNRSLKNTINLATRPNANKYIFGFPYKVWMWYAIGEPKREKEFVENGQLSQEALTNRLLLRSVMIKAGFTTITSEWWHFNATNKVTAAAKYELID